MEKKYGYLVFTPQSGEQFVKIHRYDCRCAHRKPDHHERLKSWHPFATYSEALEYARGTGRSYKNRLDCLICCPS